MSRARPIITRFSIMMDPPHRVTKQCLVGKAGPRARGPCRVILAPQTLDGLEDQVVAAQSAHVAAPLEARLARLGSAQPSR